MQSLTRHLHAFVREVRLTEDEWQARHRLPHRRRTHHRRAPQEFILLSDVLGALHADHRREQPGVRRRHGGDRLRAVLRRGLAARSSSAATSPAGRAGEPCWVEGTVTDTDGTPVPGARIEVWEADEDGFYDVQYADDRAAGRGHLFADERRRYRFWAVTPTPYPIPHDGPVGAMLDAAGPLADARLAPALHGHGARLAHASSRTSSSTAATSSAWDSVFGVKDSLVRSSRAAGRHADAGWPGPGRRRLEPGAVRHRARAGRAGPRTGRPRARRHGRRSR